ncbi:MAG: hypothetical protein AABM43_11595 [Actinomycetota bacterium]
MAHHPTLLEQVAPDLLREGEVGSVVAVQETDLPAADFEGELAAAAGAGLPLPARKVTSSVRPVD